MLNRLPSDEAAALRARGAMFLRDILARTQDEAIERALADAGHLIAQSLNGAIAILDPEVVFVSGYLASRPLVQTLQERTSGTRTHFQESVDPEGTAVRRGLALSAFRRLIFKKLDEHATHHDWWMTLPHSVAV